MYLQKHWIEPALLKLILFWIFHVLSRFNLRKRIHDPVSVTRIAFKDKQMGF